MTERPTTAQDEQGGWQPLGWRIAVAVGFLIAEIVIVLLLARVAPGNPVGTIVLLGVLVVSAAWNVWLVIAMSKRSNAAAEHPRQEADALAKQQTALLRVVTLVAIANAETHTELKASRARLVTTSDQARRRFERDLRDGAQQRVAALGLGLRTVEASVAEEDKVVRQQLDNVINGLAELYTNLQELSRDIHPAVLSKGGLGPALRALARRSTIPVSTDVNFDQRLPESIELAAYYVVAESLTNAAKYSRASRVAIRVGLEPEELRIEVADNGVGGATATSGSSGLIGLKDRVEAASGRLDISSPPGQGTTLTARFPLVSADADDPPR